MKMSQVCHRSLSALSTFSPKSLQALLTCFLGQTEPKIMSCYSISEFFTEADYVSKLYSFLPYMMMVCIQSSNLNVLTRHIDQAFQSLQILKKRILDEFFKSSDENKRYEYFYLLKRVEMLKPMTGDGYFEITKTTITSMISVRLCILNF